MDKAPFLLKLSILISILFAAAFFDWQEKKVKENTQATDAINNADTTNYNYTNLPKTELISLGS